MEYFGMTHVFMVAKRICEMAHQPLPKKGQVKHTRDDYVISSMLIEELKKAIKEVEILTQDK